MCRMKEPYPVSKNPVDGIVGGVVYGIDSSLAAPKIIRKEPPGSPVIDMRKGRTRAVPPAAFPRLPSAKKQPFCFFIPSV